MSLGILGIGVVILGNRKLRMLWKIGGVNTVTIVTLKLSDLEIGLIFLNTKVVLKPILSSK